MSPALLLGLCVVLWLFRKLLKRLFCGHSGGWETVKRVAGFGVPVLDQRCSLCGMTRAVYDYGAVRRF